MSTASKKVVMALAALSVMFFQDAVTSAEEEELEEEPDEDEPDEEPLMYGILAARFFTSSSTP